MYVQAHGAGGFVFFLAVGTATLGLRGGGADRVKFYLLFLGIGMWRCCFRATGHVEAVGCDGSVFQRCIPVWGPAGPGSADRLWQQALMSTFVSAVNAFVVTGCCVCFSSLQCGLSWRADEDSVRQLTSQGVAFASCSAGASAWDSSHQC